MVNKSDYNEFTDFYYTDFYYKILVYFLSFFLFFCFSKIVGFRLFCELLYFINYFLIYIFYMSVKSLPFSKNGW